MTKIETTGFPVEHDQATDKAVRFPIGILSGDCFGGEPLVVSELDGEQNLADRKRDLRMNLWMLSELRTIDRSQLSPEFLVIVEDSMKDMRDKIFDMVGDNTDGSLLRDIL